MSSFLPLLLCGLLAPRSPIPSRSQTPSSLARSWGGREGSTAVGCSWRGELREGSKAELACSSRALLMRRLLPSRRCVCRLRQPVASAADDLGSEGGLSEDWRKFCLSRERSSLSPPSSVLNGTTAEYTRANSTADGLFRELAWPRRGALVLAAPDAVFASSTLLRHSLCVLVEYEEQMGALALALNRPTRAVLADVVEMDLPGSMGEVPLFVGGDAPPAGATPHGRAEEEGGQLQIEAAPSAIDVPRTDGHRVRHELEPPDDSPDASLWLLSASIPAEVAAGYGRLLDAGLFLFKLEEAVALVDAGGVTPSEAGRSFNAYVGHMSWAEGKLEAEHQAGAWAVLAPSRETAEGLLRYPDMTPTGRGPLGLYEEAVRQGKPNWIAVLAAKRARSDAPSDAGEEHTPLREALSGALRLWSETAQWEAELREAEEVQAAVHVRSARESTGAALDGDMKSSVFDRIYGPDLNVGSRDLTSRWDETTEGSEWDEPQEGSGTDMDRDGGQRLNAILRRAYDLLALSSELDQGDTSSTGVPVNEPASEQDANGRQIDSGEASLPLHDPERDEQGADGSIPQSSGFHNWRRRDQALFCEHSDTQKVSSCGPTSDSATPHVTQVDRQSIAKGWRMLDSLSVSLAAAGRPSLFGPMPFSTSGTSPMRTNLAISPIDGASTGSETVEAVAPRFALHTLRNTLLHLSRGGQALLRPDPGFAPHGHADGPRFRGAGSMQSGVGAGRDGGSASRRSLKKILQQDGAVGSRNGVVRSGARNRWPEKRRLSLPASVSLPHFLIANKNAGQVDPAGCKGERVQTSELQFTLLALLLSQRMGLRVTLLEPSNTASQAGGYVLEVDIGDHDDVDDAQDDLTECDDDRKPIDFVESSGNVGDFSASLKGDSDVRNAVHSPPLMDGGFGAPAPVSGDPAWDVALAHLASTYVTRGGARLPASHDDGLLYLRIKAGRGCCDLLTAEELAVELVPQSLFARGATIPPLDALMVQLCPLDILEELASEWAAWMELRGDAAASGFWRLQLLLIEKLLVDEDAVELEQASSSRGTSQTRSSREVTLGQHPAAEFADDEDEFFVGGLDEEQDDEEEVDGSEDGEDDDGDGLLQP